MRNTEHLRNYFLGKDPQLKETMSDNALRLCGIKGKFYVLRTELMKQLADLKTLLESADETLQDNIDAEADARAGADELIVNMINNVENIQNKVTSLSSSSTDTEYPSAKCVYDGLESKMNASSVITAFWRGTQAEYDALETHDSTTLYIIDEE